MKCPFFTYDDLPSTYWKNYFLTRLDVPLLEEDELDRDDVDLLEPERDIVDRVPDDVDLLEPERDIVDRVPPERMVRLAPLMILPFDRVRLVPLLSCLFVMTVLPVYPPLDPDEYQPQK